MPTGFADFHSGRRQFATSRNFPDLEAMFLSTSASSTAAEGWRVAVVEEMGRQNDECWEDERVDDQSAKGT